MKYNFKQTALKLALVSAFALGAAGLGGKALPESAMKNGITQENGF